MSPLATAYEDLEFDSDDAAQVGNNRPRLQTSRQRMARNARFDRGNGGKAKQFNGAHLKRGRRPSGL